MPKDNISIQEGNRRQWLTIILCNLGLQSLKIKATAKQGKTFLFFQKDDSDLKLIINGEIQKNKELKSHKNWFWCGRVLKGNSKTFEKELRLGSNIHYFELWVDRSPEIEEIKLIISKTKIFSIFTLDDIQKYTYKGINKNEDYNRFDEEILEATNFWNEFFFFQKYPPQKVLDPNLVKAMIYVESRMGCQETKEGYYPAYPDVMQVWDEANKTPQTIRGEKNYFANEYISDIEINHMSYSYPKEWLPPKVETPKESIFWGVRWFYHKTQHLSQKKDSQKLIYPYQREWIFWQEALSGYNYHSWYKKRILKIYQEGIDQNKNILWGKESNIEEGKINFKLLIFSLIFIVAIFGISFFFFGNFIFKSKILPKNIEIIEKIQLNKNQYVAILQDMGSNQIGVALLDKKMRLKEWLPQAEILSPEEKDLIKGDHFEWWKMEDINKDDLKEIAIQLQYVGPGRTHIFYLYQEKNNKFNLLLFFDDGDSNTELKDLNGDGIQEIEHSFSLDCTGMAGRQLTPWKEVYFWKEGKYQKANHLFSEIYQELLKTYDSFLVEKDDPSIIFYQPIINCLKEKAQLNSQGVFGDGRTCVKI